MAITFRDFMLGLAKSAPMIADILEKYTTFQMQQYEMMGQQQLREQQGRYYEELTKSQILGQDTEKIQQDNLKLTQKEMKDLMPLKMREQENRTREQEIATLMKETDWAAMEQYSSPTGQGAKQLAIDKINNLMEQQRLSLKELETGINANLSTITSNTGRDRLNEINASRTSMDYIHNLWSVNFGLLKNKEDLPKLVKVFDKHVRGENVDMPNLMKELQELSVQGVLMSPQSAEALSNVAAYIDRVSIDFKSGLANSKIEREAVLRDLLKTKEGKATLKDFYGIENEQQLIDNNNIWEKSQLSQPFLDQLNILGKGWTKKTMDLRGLPNYDSTRPNYSLYENIGNEELPSNKIKSKVTKPQFSQFYSE